MVVVDWVVGYESSGKGVLIGSAAEVTGGFVVAHPIPTLPVVYHAYSDLWPECILLAAADARRHSIRLVLGNVKATLSNTEKQ